MAIVLPTFVNGQPFSASQMNVLSEVLRSVKAIADRPRHPFREAAAGATGYIQHQQDTLEYRISGGTITVVYGGNSLGGLTGNGTVDLSSAAPGLVAGQVYQITTSGTGTIEYLAERYDPAYVAAPAFTNGVAPTVTNFNNLADRINELINLSNARPTTSIYINNGRDWEEDVEDDPIEVANFWLRHEGDTVEFVFEHSAESKGTLSQKCRFELDINGSNVFSHTLKNAPPAGFSLVDRWAAGSGRGGRRFLEILNGTFSISSLGLTVGTFYKWEIKQFGSGSSKKMNLDNKIIWLAQSSSGAAWTDPPTWTEDAQNISAARLNIYKTDIDRLNPNSGGPTSPMFYENPVQFTWTGETKRIMRHFKKFLIHRWDTKGTSEIFPRPVGREWGPPYNLASKTGTLFTDMDKVPNFFYGDLFLVDDVDLCFETDDVVQL